jgi:hypothetical protein
MFHFTPFGAREPALRSITRPPSGQTPLCIPLGTPFLPYLLCVAHRLDLLVARRVPGGRTPAMPPLC